MKRSETTEKAICEDPFWAECEAKAMHVRIGENRTSDNYLIYLCEECYEAMLDTGEINSDEWEEITD